MICRICGTGFSISKQTGFLMGAFTILSKASSMEAITFNALCCDALKDSMYLFLLVNIRPLR